MQIDDLLGKLGKTKILQLHGKLTFRVGRPFLFAQAFLHNLILLLFRKCFWFNEVQFMHFKCEVYLTQEIYACYSLIYVNEHQILLTNPTEKPDRQFVQ